MFVHWKKRLSVCPFVRLCTWHLKFSKIFSILGNTAVALASEPG